MGKHRLNVQGPDVGLGDVSLHTSKSRKKSQLLMLYVLGKYMMMDTNVNTNCCDGLGPAEETTARAKGVPLSLPQNFLVQGWALPPGKPSLVLLTCSLASD